MHGDFVILLGCLYRANDRHALATADLQELTRGEGLAPELFERRLGDAHAGGYVRADATFRRLVLSDKGVAAVESFR